MTPDKIRAARETLNLTQQQLAVLLGFEDRPNARQALYRLESGIRDITTAQERLLQAYLDGYRPADWPA